MPPGTADPADARAATSAGWPDARAATSAGWPDVQSAFDVPGDPGRCYCQWFRLAGHDFTAASDADRRAALEAEVAAGPPGPGVVVYRDGVPAGWVGVGPRRDYPRLLRGALLRGSADAADAANDVWSLTCLIVRPEHRRQGLAGDLVEAAVAHAREHGATVLEAYPIDTAARTRASAAELYHGTIGLFERAGFAVARRPSPGRAVMRRDC